MLLVRRVFPSGGLQRASLRSTVSNPTYNPCQPHPATDNQQEDRTTLLHHTPGRDRWARVGSPKLDLLQSEDVRSAQELITCHSTTSRCLREIIERNALRRNLKSRTLGTNDVSLDQADRLPCIDSGPETLVLQSIARCEAFEVVDRLTQERQLTDANLRVLRHIAAGSDPAIVPELAGRCPSTAQARRRRAAQLLRDPRTRTALLAAVG
jgi:hypothetical protein